MKISALVVNFNQMLRPLFLFLCLWFCPAWVWATDDFCGHRQAVSHSCPMHAGQSCQCHEHELCYRIALEKPNPKAPAPARYDFICPPLVRLVFACRTIGLTESQNWPPAPTLCPSLAPEPPPPKS